METMQAATAVTSGGEESEPRPTVRDFEEPWNFLDIDLDRLAANWAHLRSRLARHRAMYAVVKADAYGHGIEEVGRTLAATGCRHFAVESPQEGMQLRRMGIDGEVLLLNPIPAWMSEMAVFYDLSVTVIHPSILPALQEASRTQDKRCRVHLNVNVGLHRLGIAPSRLLRVAKDVVSRPELELEGLMAQPRDDKNALPGFEKLNLMHDLLADHGIVPRRLHFANSTVLLTHPETMADGARIGILLYGVLPPEQYGRSDLHLHIEPVMALTTSVVQTRDLPAGSRIGYRARSRTTRDSVIGTIPIGYSHGLDRTLAKGGHVLVRGALAPFVGAISMNSATIDLTDVDGARIGDRVTVIGRDGDHEIVINDLASHSSTISAELMVRFGSGIARRYTASELNGSGNGKAIRVADGVRLRVVHAQKDLPAGADARHIIAFLESHLAPHDDPEDVIREALDYSLSSYRGGDGFVVLATEGSKIVGALTCARTGTAGFIPENVIGYVCVHRDRRGEGIGRSLLETAIGSVEGDFKLHVANENPAHAFYEKLGFRSDYKEMRLLRGSRGRTWRT